MVVNVDSIIRLMDEFETVIILDVNTSKEIMTIVVPEDTSDDIITQNRSEYIQIKDKAVDKITVGDAYAGHPLLLYIKY